MSEIMELPRYEARHHLTRWEAVPVLNNMLRHPLSLVSGTVGGVSATAVLSLILAFVLDRIIDLIPGYDADYGTLYLVSAVVLLPFVTYWTMGQAHSQVDVDMISQIKKRIEQYAGTQLAAHHLVDSRTTLNLILKDEALLKTGRSRTTLLRLDAILIRLKDTLGELGADADAKAKAHGIALASFVEVIEQHRTDLAMANSESNALDRLQDFCRDVASGGNGLDLRVAPTAPTARIARIVETAEKMLAVHPNMVDSQGARVADLVRRHVPRLLGVHAEATLTAPTDSIGAVDAELETGVEHIRASVEEAAGLLHDEAMDALATELRFLALRRGSVSLLTSAA